MLSHGLSAPSAREHSPGGFAGVRFPPISPVGAATADRSLWSAVAVPTGLKDGTRTRRCRAWGAPSRTSPESGHASASVKPSTPSQAGRERLAPDRPPGLALSSVPPPPEVVFHSLAQAFGLQA